MSRDEQIARIAEKKQEMKTAGVIHKKDLRKYIHRLETELMRYDRYRQAVS
jgi:hypothetical protein